MKKVIIASIIVIGIIASGVAVLNSKDKQQPQSSETSQQTSSPVESTTKNIRQEGVTKGEYIAYSQDNFDKAMGVKILFFHADWCRQCQDIERSIGEKGLPAGVTIFKVPYDTATSLRKQYGVTLQTTFVKVTNTGELIEKYVAYEEPHIDSVARELL